MTNRHKGKHNTTITHKPNVHAQSKTGSMDRRLDDPGQNQHHQMSTNQSVNSDYLHPPLDKGWGKELPHDHWSSAPDLGGHF
jgi:hypothetical protein